jgi:uncharacterized protein (DUF1499 family)
MKKAVGRLLFVLLVGGGLWAVTAWPRLNGVETGRTPEYPDLQPRSYVLSPQRVGQALKKVLRDRPGWTVVGSGEGPEGVALTAVHETRFLPFKEDVTARIRRQGGRTVVSVRSRSRIGKWDFGQNARNVRELLAALDAEVYTGHSR